MAIFARHPDLNRAGAVVRLNMREERRKANEGGKKGSSTSSMGFSSPPPLCGRKRRREDAGLKMKPSAGKATISPSYQKGLQAEDGQPKQLTCPGTLGLQTQACLLQQSRWLRRLGG